MIVLFRLLSDISEDTSIHIKDMAVHEIRSIRCEEYYRSHEVLWITPAFCRCLCHDEGIEWMTASVWLALTEWSSLRSSDVSWTDSVTLDVVCTIL